MRRAYPTMPDPTDRVSDRLREELYLARRTIIHLMPDTIQDILTSYHGCETSQATRLWESEVVDALISLVEPAPNASPGFLPNRAFCPLCHHGSSSPFADGFIVPEGLRRHLEGYGNVRQCDVMVATEALAWDAWQRRFGEADAAEAAQAKAKKEQRKSTEALYRLGPKDEPELLDEHIGFGRAMRDPAEFAWAVARLTTLGFQLVSEGRVTSFTLSGKDFVVYADPRAKGEIWFRVYRIPPPRKFSGSYMPFDLKDAWKHDLKAKFDIRLAKALGRPSP